MLACFAQICFFIYQIIYLFMVFLYCIVSEFLLVCSCDIIVLVVFCFLFPYCGGVFVSGFSFRF
jgi:hypothetical protein